MSKVTRYMKAVERWFAAGRPQRPPVRVKELYEMVCKPCPHFNTKGSCNICGCRVRASGKALLNKLAMATERCPDNPPRFPAEVEPKSKGGSEIVKEPRAVEEGSPQKVNHIVPKRRGSRRWRIRGQIRAKRRG